MSTAGIRDHLIQALQADLVGPYDVDQGDTAVEVLSMPPSRWYLTGFLATEQTRDNDDPEADDEGGAGDDLDDGATAAAVAESGTTQRKLFPASMGLSVLLPPGQGDVLTVRVRYAEYHLVQGAQDAAESDDSGENSEAGEGKRPRRHWKRVPYVVDAVVPLTLGELPRVRVPNTGGLELEGRLEATHGVTGLADGTRALSLFLINRRMEQEPKELGWVFQVSLELQPPPGQAFVARPDLRAADSRDLDDQVADLQFRRVRSYGVGHGVSVEEDPAGAWVRTCWLPQGRVPKVTTRSVPTVTTSMEALAALDDGPALRTALLPLVDAYQAWIQAQAALGVGGGQRAQTRDRLMAGAGDACARIQRGIERLAADAEARRAFCWMNGAMAQAARQRSADRYAGDKVPEWRLFQLAFVLLNVCGIADEDNPERDIVELIFFPTGGGKTEA
ncbi:MAG: hypothetical protein KC613_06310, partial [Myxococcales bacterium]|nr:hypothetical protein [Myxococcales bacterium]